MSSFLSSLAFPQSLAEAQQWWQYALDKGHPRVKDWPLMNPIHVLSLTAAYLIGIKLLTIYMSTREKVNVKNIASLHNLAMTLLSLYMCLETINQAFIQNSYTLFSNSIDSTPKGEPMSRILWIFFASKLPEFVDTILMALKKNFHQISFLHLYHHSSVFIIQWITVYYGPGGESYLAAILNSGVHVFMYGYYLWSTYDSKPKEGERITWTKAAFYRPYITRIQLIQFVILFTQSIWDIFISPPKDYPIFVIWILLFYMISMIALFMNFYIQAYIKKGSRKTAAAKKEE